MSDAIEVCNELCRAATVTVEDNRIGFVCPPVFENAVRMAYEVVLREAGIKSREDARTVVDSLHQPVQKQHDDPKSVPLPEGWRVVEDSCVGVVMKDENGQFISCNPIDMPAWRRLVLYELFHEGRS